MSTEQIEQWVTLIVLNARNLPHDGRRELVAAACRDLEEGGFDAQTRQHIERRVLERLNAEPQPS